jgi:hypothetical protein
MKDDRQKRNRMKQLFILGVFAIMALTMACTREPRSAIVQKVDEGGCASLSGVSTDAIQKCLAQRRQLAIEVDQMCKPVRESAPAQWNDTTEGRVCAAARNLAFWRSSPVQGDGKTYDPTK